MEDKKVCKIVQDLLPSYIDNLTTQETNDYINEHLNKCQECKQILENMRKDLSTTKNYNREVKYIKKFNKKMNILKMLILLIIIIFLVITARKIFIISNLSQNAKNTMNIENYHRIIYSYDLGNYSKTEVFCLNDKKKIVMTQMKNDEITKITMFAKKSEESKDGQDEYITNIYRESKDEKIANLNQENQIYVNPQNVVYVDNWLKLFMYSMVASVKNTTFAGKECYYISNFQNANSISSEAMYINKETGLPISTIAYEYKNPDGTRGRFPSADYVYEFNVVTEEDFIEPDIKDYKIVQK